MKALVTGATGFVGSAVARKLVAAGHQVRTLVRPTSDRRNLENLAVEAVVGDLRDPASLAAALAGCDTLFHVAADYRLWVPDPETIYAVNVDGSRALIEAAMSAGIERIVYTSSVATLGLNQDGTPAHEDTPVALGHMIGHYKRSKFLAEQAVQSLIQGHGAPVVIVNPSTPVGPRDVKPTPTGRMIVEAAAGRMPAYVDTGLNLVHVDDVAEGHLLAIDHGVVGERYVLGGADMTLEAILCEVARITGGRPPRLRLAHNLIMPLAVAAEAWARLSGAEPFATVDGLRMAKKKMFFTSAKAETALGYKHRPAAEALAEAIAWFRANNYLD
ncbi:MAG: hopanoid-associated sugar epimerase [Alphaproteobacteria bacterium]|jgi:dihydroflavonol-4-reductase